MNFVSEIKHRFFHLSEIQITGDFSITLFTVYIKSIHILKRKIYLDLAKRFMKKNI